jgi:predicted GNAT family N-acyltransferase
VVVDKVRIARTAGERRAIYRLRYEVYVLEQDKRYAHANHRRRELADPVDEVSTHYYIADGDLVVAAARAYLGPATPTLAERFAAGDEPLIHGGTLHCAARFCVAAAARHMLLGWQLARAAYLHGRSQGVERTYLHCAPQLATLYERLGYERYRGTFEDPTVGTQTPLRLRAADEHWLRQRLSPFAPLAAAYRVRGEAWSRAVTSTFHEGTM